MQKQHPPPDQRIVTILWRGQWRTVAEAGTLAAMESRAGNFAGALEIYELIAAKVPNSAKRRLTPHTNTSPVETASQWQVRQPIYKDSLKRWRHYEQHLGPLKEALMVAQIVV